MSISQPKRYLGMEQNLTTAKKGYMGHPADCPRCHGNGHIKAFGHVRAGVCFRCWGCGLDIAGQRDAAMQALTQARFEWLRLKRLSGSAVGNRAHSLQSALDSIRACGEEAKARMAELTVHLEGLKASHAVG